MRISDWSSDVGSSDLPFTCDARIFTSSSKTLSIPFAATDWERARNATTDSEWACWKSWNFMVTSVRLAKACDDELTNCLTFYEVAIMGRKILALIVVKALCGNFLDFENVGIRLQESTGIGDRKSTRLNSRH